MASKNRLDLNYSDLGPHPEPPADLYRRPLPLFESTGPWFSFHKAHYEPLCFGSHGSSRFAAPSGEYEVLYLANDVHGAFIETYGQSTGSNVIASKLLSERCLAHIVAVRPMVLVDLSGPGLAHLGADARLWAGEHGIAQRWALALWSHPSKPDGLYYRARHDPSRFCLALFNRTSDALQVTCQGNLLDPTHGPLLADIIDTYRFVLLDDAA